MTASRAAPENPNDPPPSAEETPEAVSQPHVGEETFAPKSGLGESAGESLDQAGDGVSEEVIGTASEDDQATEDPAAGDPDRDLVQAASDGDPKAFEELVLRHQNRVYTHVFFMVRDAELASDLTQECFLRAWRGLASFRREARFATWVKRIAVNVTLHHFEKTRAQKRSASVFSISSSGPGGDEEGAFEIPDQGPAPDSKAIDGERKAAIMAAVGELDPEYRTALALRELQGYSYQEITEVLNLPIGTVKSKIFRARQILQEKLKAYL